MKLRTAADAAVRQPPLPDSPVISVFFGDADDPGDLGLLKVAVPAGAGMPPHRHHGSDVILIPVAGFVRIVKGEEQIDVYPGDAAFIDKDEAVSLTNPGSQDAQVFVAAGPASFVRTVLAWAAVDAATEDTSAREDARDEDAEPVAEAS
ncbi:cupin domain-containing protein [Ruania albidiflava]|uniref:cupin domain-containing protein n=1 Tax=Ruania albidiflava TaxID=366586 RepID=UPI0003B6323B|nr:cupin domain-containing protein [Ruania albidiflava]